MSLGMELGLGPDDFVLDGDPAPLPKRGAEPPIFGKCLLWPNGWMDEAGTWHGGRPQVGLSPGDFVLDGEPAPLRQKGSELPSPILGPFLLWPNGWASRCQLVRM